MSAQSDLPWFALIAIFFWAKYKRKGKGKGKEGIPEPYHKIPKRLTIEQLRELSTAVGMADPDVAAAVAMAESSGRTDAVGDKGESIGLWQIHVPSAPKQWANKDMLKHAGFNAQAALAMSNGGTDWNSWSTFRSRAYLTYMPKSR